MKPGSTRKSGLLIMLAVVGIATLAFISWDNPHQQHYQQAQDESDTIPGKRDRKVRDLDEAIQELEEVNIDMEIENAMKEVSKALKELDVQKAQLDVQRAMKEIDMVKMKADIDKAMKEIDFKKIEQEVKESLAKIDFEKMQAELEKVKEVNMKEVEASMEEAKEQMEKLGPQLEKQLKNAKVEIEKAKSELKEYKGFVDGLENEGLINKKEGYTIKHRDGKLTINDKEASQQTYQKYRSFLEKHKKFSIEKDDDDFDIDMD